MSVSIIHILCVSFVIAFVPLSGKKNLTTKALKGYTKDLNNGS